MSRNAVSRRPSSSKRIRISCKKICTSSPSSGGRASAAARSSSAVREKAGASQASGVESSSARAGHTTVSQRIARQRDARRGKRSSSMEFSDGRAVDWGIGPRTSAGTKSPPIHSVKWAEKRPHSIRSHPLQHSRSGFLSKPGECHRRTPCCFRSLACPSRQLLRISP